MLLLRNAIFRYKKAPAGMLLLRNAIYEKMLEILNFNTSLLLAVTEIIGSSAPSIPFTGALCYA